MQFWWTAIASSAAGCPEHLRPLSCGCRRGLVSAGAGRLPCSTGGAAYASEGRRGSPTLVSPEPGTVALHVDEIDIEVGPKVALMWPRRGYQPTVPMPGENWSRHRTGAPRAQSDKPVRLEASNQVIKALRCTADDCQAGLPRGEAAAARRRQRHQSQGPERREGLARNSEFWIFFEPAYYAPNARGSGGSEGRCTAASPATINGAPYGSAHGDTRSFASGYTVFPRNTYRLVEPKRSGRVLGSGFAVTVLAFGPGMAS